MPPPYEKNEIGIKKELAENFPTIDPLLLGQLIEISYVLATGPVMVSPVLKKLESKLLTRYENNSTADKKNGSFFSNAAQLIRSDTTSKVKSADSKILTAELSEQEQAAGFQILPGGRVKIYAAVVSPATFEQQQIEEPMHFKDMVSANHGEYTHRIQWYIFYFTLTQMGLPLNSMYKTYIEILKHSTLWDHIFDRQPETSTNQPPFAWNNYDFRSPEAFNFWLKDQAQKIKFPILNRILNKRHLKRTESTYDPAEYLAKKIHNKSFQNLSGPEQTDILNAVTGMNSYYKYDGKMTTYQKGKS